MNTAGLETTFFFFFFSFEKIMVKKKESMFNLNFKAMQNFTIKTHAPNTLHLTDHFYILSKGMNSGKPLNEPCPNCFVITFPNAQEKENYYWLAYTLWKSKFWHRYLVGTAIQFLRLWEFKKLFTTKSDALQKDYEQHLKNVMAFQLLQKKESNFKKSLSLIQEMQAVILFRYNLN